MPQEKRATRREGISKDPDKCWESKEEFCFET